MRSDNYTGLRCMLAARLRKATTRQHHNFLQRQTVSESTESSQPCQADETMHDHSYFASGEPCKSCMDKNIVTFKVDYQTEL